MTTHRIFQALGHSLLALMIAAPLIVAPVKPAKAAMSDCADALSETVDLANYLAGQASSIAQCGQTMSTSPPATAAVGVLVTLVYAAGQFNDEATCKGLVNSTISKMLAELIKSSPKLQTAMKGLLGEDGLKKFLEEAGTQAVEALAGQPPFDMVFGLMNCSCTVLGTGIETINRTKEIASDVTQCAATIGNVIAGGAEALHCQLGSCLTPGVQQYQCGGAAPVYCQPGQDSKTCYLMATLNNPDQKNYNNFCGYQTVCQGSATIDGKKSVPDYSQAFFKPSPDAAAVPVNICYCPAGQGFDSSPSKGCIPCSGDGKVVGSDGVCRSWTCAADPAYKKVSYGKKYNECKYEQPTCTGGMVWDRKINACNHCPDNTVFKASKTGGAGTCEACSWDESLKYTPGPSGVGWSVGGSGPGKGAVSLDKLKCQRLVCEGLSHPSKDTPHECAPCKEVFNAGGAMLVGLNGKKLGNKPVCLDGFDQVEIGKPCPRGTVRAQGAEGVACVPILKAQDPVAPHVKLKKEQGPVERVSNPGQSITNTRRSLAPDLDDIGGGSGAAGSTAPGVKGGGGGMKGTPALPSSTPTMRSIAPSYSTSTPGISGGNYKP